MNELFWTSPIKIQLFFCIPWILKRILFDIVSVARQMPGDKIGFQSFHVKQNKHQKNFHLTESGCGLIDC